MARLQLLSLLPLALLGEGRPGTFLVKTVDSPAQQEYSPTAKYPTGTVRRMDLPVNRVAVWSGRNAIIDVDSPASLFADYWAWRLRRSPEFATMTGDRRHNSKLETFTQVDNAGYGCSDTSFQLRFSEDLDSSMKFARRCDVLLETTEDKTQLLNLKFFSAEVSAYVTGYPFSAWHFPISYLEGVQVDFQRLAEWASLDTIRDYQDLVLRSAMPRS
jgi:hypothetical protein